MILLSGHSLTPVSKIPIESMSLRLRERDSTAVITMAGADLHGVTINSWVKDDNGMIWRVRNIQHKYADSTVEIQLEHVILALKDLILFGEITPATITGNASATTCTALQAITYILAQHPDWTLGTYGYGTVTNAYKFDGDNLYDALERVCNTLDDPWWTLDTSVYPFQISIAPKQSGVACELRPDRNLSAITRTVDMSGCYTRFYPIGKGDLHITGGYVSKNESTYGVIARVETDQSLETEAELIAWANERLGKHAEPEVTVRAQGFDLAEATGEPLDQLTLGRICRVPLPEYNTTILDRITELYYPDLLRAPESVEITMANRTEDITRIIANEIKTGGGRGGSGGRRAARVEGMVEEFDNSDIWINRDSVWAVCGAYNVITDLEGNKHIQLKDGSLLEVKRDGIYETVGTSQAITEVDNKVTNTIMGSALWIRRNNITGVCGEFDVVEETDPDTGTTVKHLKIVSGGGITIERNQTEFGLWDSGNLTGGVMVNKINGNDVEVKIKAARVDLGAYATVGQLEAVSAEIQNITGGTIVENYVGASLVTGTTVTANSTFVHDGDTIYKRAMRWTSGGSVIATVHALGDTSSIILNHSHAMTVDSNGVVTVGDAQTSSGTFNIADTAFHKARVASAWNSGGSTAHADQSSQYAPYGGSVTIKILYTDNSGTERDTGRSVTIWNTSCSHTFKEQTFTSNGTYYASTSGYSGYSKVEISVRTTKHSNCADSLTKSGTHALMYVPDSNGITISTKVKNISNASRVWYYRGSDQNLFTAYT